MAHWRCLGVVLTLLLAAYDQAPETAATTTTMPPTTHSGESTTSTSARPTLDLSGDLVWFASLPPMPTGPGREFTGSEDFMDLFAPDAAWETAAGHVDVFKLYGEWVAYHATPAQLREAVGWIQSHGLALAVEAGEETLLHEFAGDTADGDVLEVAPSEPWIFRYVRVETVESPSWVAWYEIEVISTG